MLCAISGEAPQTPVASRKSGTVYEKRLIEAYIQENGKDPVNGEELSLDDLVELKTARAVRPRPPALTSIPSLLAALQGEWDALALESFTLKQHLSQLRQELSTALYNNDAAVKVVARLTQERDEARDALAKVTMQDRRNARAGAGPSGANGSAAEEDAMQVDAQALPQEVAAKIDATRERLSKTRRKRPVPEDWVTPEEVQGFSPGPPAEVLSSTTKAFALDASGRLAVLGGVDGSSAVYDVEARQVLHTGKASESAVNDVLVWRRGDATLSALATSSGEVLVLEEGREVASASHSGPATGITVHPSGDLVASVGTDKSVCLLDLATGGEVSRIHLDSPLTCCHFHPDGHLLAVGTSRSQIVIFDAKSQAVAAQFDAAGPLQSLCFSENGFWLAAAHSGSSRVGVWDLRKMAEIKSLDFGVRVDRVRWDYTGQYLAGGGPEGVCVQYYDKSTKAWSELLKKAVAASGPEWGPQGKSMVLLTADGALSLMQ